MARNKERNDRYFQLHHYLGKTDAWRALSAGARAIYVQIGLRYNGANNGRISYSVRDAASECNLNKDTAGRAIHELVNRGFIEETRHGGLSRKTRIASEWRLTAFRCDLTGAAKTCAFMHRGGSGHSSYTPQKRGRLPGAIRPSPVRNKYRECPKKRDSLSETNTDDAPECPKLRDTQAGFCALPVPIKGTHIIYQVAPASESGHGKRQDAPAATVSHPAAGPAEDLLPGALPPKAQRNGSPALTPAGSLRPASIRVLRRAPADPPTAPVASLQTRLDEARARASAAETERREVLARNSDRQTKP